MLKTKDGYAKVIGTSYQGSSDYVLLSNGGSKAISSLSVNYANSAGSATKLVTARKIWGQSFNGTADVNGTIYINNGDSENGAIILNNNVNSNARISAIKDNVVFNTGGAIRFGDLDWDYSKWAGLKYDYLTKTIYLGIADGSIFTTYEGAQSEGTLNLRANISYIDLNSGTSIRGLSTNGSPYHSTITLKDTSMSLSTYGDMTMSTGPGTMQLSAANAFRVNANDMRFTCKGGFIECSQTGSNEYTWVFNNNIKTTGQIVREGSSQSWVNGRKGALLRETSVNGYHTLWSLKTTDGSWDFGEFNAGSSWNNIPVLTYITDTDFNNGKNVSTYQIKFPLASGTVALTSNILNPTNYYWANIKVSASSNTQTKPSVNTIYANNWFRSQGATGWYNESYGGGLHMTDTTWIRTFGNKSFYCNKQIYSSDSIRMGDIYLEHTNEINSASGLHLNYRNSSNVSLCQGGGAVIIGHTPDNIGNNKLYVNGPTTLNSVATFNGLVTNNGGILPASYDVNKNNTACYVWGDAMSTGVTAITDALDPKYVSIHYSNDNGTSWSDMKMSNQDKFCLYANNGDRSESVYLGHQGTAESLTQVQKNQLMVTFEIPNTMYSALCWASIDINGGVQTTCTVEIIAKDGTIKNTFTKNLYGWNALNYINFWGNNNPVVNIGHDITGKFVRFKFKHDANNTDVRNTQIFKIRLFSFTKYNLNINDRRSLMAYTGHLYTYDQNLNVKFPNALNVGGTLTITPTSNGYYEEANYPGAVIDTYYNNNYLQIGKSNGELILDTNSDKGNINPALYIKDFVSANRLFKFNTGLAVPPVHLMNASNADATITIQGEKYNAYYVGTQGNAIGKSFILADNSINHKQVIVIRKGVDGEVCFIKDAGKETFRYYLQNTQLMLAGDQTIQKSGTFSFGFDDGKARFIIYSERNNTWYEFYCG